MDFQQFKKDLLEEMRAALKPHGFAKYGHRFRCARENGVACMVEVYGHRCGGTLMIQVYFGVLAVPVTAESWKNWEIQWMGCLGQSLEDGWHNHHWIEPYDEDDPRVKDGCITRRFKPEDGPWQEEKVPVQTPRQATAEVCYLLQNKMLPLFDTLQTPEDYARFCKEQAGPRWIGGVRQPSVFRFFAQTKVMDVSEILPQIDLSIRFYTKNRDGNRQSLQKLEQQIAQSRLKKPNKWQCTSMSYFEKNIQDAERYLAEYEELRRELVTASSQKE